MKKKHIIILSFFVFTASLIFNSCEEPVTPEENKKPLIFTELTSDEETIYPEETVTFNAVASGDEIVYEWESSVGTLLGNGNQVTLTPTPCLTGEITVTCTVRDKYDETSSKNITITVLEL